MHERPERRPRSGLCGMSGGAPERDATVTATGFRRACNERTIEQRAQGADSSAGSLCPGTEQGKRRNGFHQLLSCDPYKACTGRSAWRGVFGPGPGANAEPCASWHGHPARESTVWKTVPTVRELTVWETVAHVSAPGPALRVPHKGTESPVRSRRPRTRSSRPHRHYHRCRRQSTHTASRLRKCPDP